MLRGLSSPNLALALVLPAALGGAACSGAPDSAAGATGAGDSSLTTSACIARVGGKIFFDTRLSEPQGQACASCHAPRAAFTDPNHASPVSHGATPWHVGNRSAPSAAYAQFSPALAFDTKDSTWKGGQFWDGRASSLEDQAKGPFLNPLEMGNPSKAAVVGKIQSGPYADEFRAAFGKDIFADVDAAYDAVAHAIATFERTPRFAPLSSKYDAFLRGEATLSASEARGLALFNDPKKGNCAACHPSTGDSAGSPPLFTDFSYDNLGLPKNPANPFYDLPASFNPDGHGFVDHGLMNTVHDAAYDGHFKVPTLRNVALTAPYMHNGYFNTLREVVDFYNTRDVAAWPSPEVPGTVNHDELGHLGLTSAEVDDIVAFMGALTDGYDTDDASSGVERP